jgi:D-apiose dehydrogenase
MHIPLRGAIAGCGFFGQIHLEGWRRIPEAEIVAACDIDLSKACQSAPRGFDELERMLDAVHPDFLDIATRPELHLPMLRIAAERKIPVICQKPMAPRWEECLEMVRVAEAAGIPFMIHENWRWQPWYRVIAAQIASGALGAPVTYTFRTRKRDGAGPEPYSLQPYFRSMPRLLLFETLVHHIDTSRFLFGELDTLFTRLRRVNAAIQGEDQVLMIASHQSGLNGIIDGNRFLDLTPDSPRWAMHCLSSRTAPCNSPPLAIFSASPRKVRNSSGRMKCAKATVGFRPCHIASFCRLPHHP